MLHMIKKIRNFIYYQRVVLYGYDLNKDHKFETDVDYTLCEPSFEDIRRTYHDVSNPDLNSIEWDIWEDKISKGHWKGFVCKDGNSVVAQAFYSVEDVFFGGTKWVVLSMPKRSAYGFKLYTRPDYRGKRLGQAITSFRLNSAKKSGIEKFYTIINSDNKISRHNEEKIGGYLVGSVFFIKCRFFNLAIVSPFILKEGFRIKEIFNYS